MSGDPVFSAFENETMCISKPREDLRSLKKTHPPQTPNKLENLPFKSYMPKERKSCMVSVCLNPGMCVFISTAFDQ